jgi:site-specific recombinase XerD
VDKGVDNPAPRFITLFPRGAVQRSETTSLPLAATSSYCLRHAFAMRLLRRGVGIKAIGDLLGHHSLEATCMYLRVDTDMLREVALPVPTLTH